MFRSFHQCSVSMAAHDDGEAHGDRDNGGHDDLCMLKTVSAVGRRNGGKRATERRSIGAGAKADGAWKTCARQSPPLHRLLIAFLTLTVIADAHGWLVVPEPSRQQLLSLSLPGKRRIDEEDDEEEEAHGLHGHEGERSADDIHAEDGLVAAEHRVAAWVQEVELTLVIATIRPSLRMGESAETADG